MSKLPTGEEPPKGFEQIFESRKKLPQIGEYRTNYVTLSQLAQSEIKEIRALAQRATDYYIEVHGVQPDKEKIEELLQFMPKGSTASDKLIFRAYSGKLLVGYAQIICAWPEADEWTVLTLLVDPSFRELGIGNKLVQTIEDHAKNTLVSAARMIAIPSMMTNTSFWTTTGYTSEVARFEWKIGETPREIVMLRKSFVDE